MEVGFDSLPAGMVKEGESMSGQGRGIMGGFARGRILLRLRCYGRTSEGCSIPKPLVPKNQVAEGSVYKDQYNTTDESW